MGRKGNKDFLESKGAFHDKDITLCHISFGTERVSSWDFFHHLQASALQVQNFSPFIFAPTLFAPTLSAQANAMHSFSPLSSFMQLVGMSILTSCPSSIFVDWLIWRALNYCRSRRSHWRGRPQCCRWELPLLYYSVLYSFLWLLTTTKWLFKNVSL